MVDPSELRLGMVAGEASGDLLAALLMQGLRSRWSGLHAAGIGGPRMVAEGFEAWTPSSQLSVFGYVEALKRLPQLLWTRGATRRRLLRWRPDVFVGIDAPDFNFGLETALRRGGLRTVHFVCPSIWAWRPHRVARLRAAADHVLCLFPFEPALLEQAGVAASYVGHPLADVLPVERPTATARRALGLDEQVRYAALLPGSRAAEVRHIAPVLLQAALELHARRPQLRFLVPMAPGLEPQIREVLAPLVAKGVAVLFSGRAHEVLAAADVAWVASGTATLEAALLKCPMVVVYRLAQADWNRMQRMRLQPWVGLPNILSGEFVVPERIQDDAQPRTLADDAEAWLDDAARAHQFRERCTAMHHVLRQDTGARAAQALEGVLSGR